MNVKKIVFILAGNSLYALAVTLFVLPNGLITGGTTGLALAVQHFLGTPISAFVGIFNALMFLLGLFALGKIFALTTVLSSFYYPFILEVFQRVLNPWMKGQPLTQDPLLAAIFAGILIGVGIGIVIRAGASTGGMDIPPLVLNKKFHLSISATMYGFDCLILFFQFLFSDTEQVLYGLLLILIYTLVLNKALVLGKGQMQVKIISKEFLRISQEIQTKMDRGTTLFKIKGGHEQTDSCAVLTVVSSRELTKVNDLAMEIDPQAFIVIHQVNEVRGRGFTLPKEYPNRGKSIEKKESEESLLQHGKG